MTIECALLNDTRMVTLDERTPLLGGSFYNSPHTQPYSPLPLRWCFDQLAHHKKAVMLDVGASTGAFSLLAKFHPDLTVYAFEPAELTYRVLNENIYLNWLSSKVECIHKGVSNYNGVGTFNEIKDIGGLGVSLLDGTPAWHKDTRPVEVEVVTIDSFCEDRHIRPSFIKIDVEGGEKLVLEGAAKTIEKYKPFLLLETSQENANQYGYATWEIIKLVEELGYTHRSPEGLDAWCVHRDWEQYLT